MYKSLAAYYFPMAADRWCHTGKRRWRCDGQIASGARYENGR
jgi:hypothetical protein